MDFDRIKLPEQPSILVVALRRLGDVLLTTPLIRSIRRAWPDACIDVLAFADTVGILEGNPDVDRVVSMPPQPTTVQTVALAARMFRRYDLAVSTQSGDRPVGFAILAGRRRVAPIEDRFSGRIKRALLTRSLAHDPRAHRVETILRLADVLGIARVAEVVPPQGRQAERPQGDYAVIHAAPMFAYKRWTIEGWRAVAGTLAERGLTVVATGGPSREEQAYLDVVWRDSPVLRWDGRLDWTQLADLLTKARVFVGPDTSVTHLAAACGCPTLALYGPTDPRLWGPWPTGGLEEPWVDAAPVQNRGNVRLVQHTFPCTPCQLEGCERSRQSGSKCLTALTPDQVFGVTVQAVEWPAASKNAEQVRFH